MLVNVNAMLVDFFDSHLKKGKIVMYFLYCPVWNLFIGTSRVLSFGSNFFYFHAMFDKDFAK